MKKLLVTISITLFALTACGNEETKKDETTSETIQKKEVQVEQKEPSNILEQLQQQITTIALPELDTSDYTISDFYISHKEDHTVAGFLDIRKPDFTIFKILIDTYQEDEAQALLGDELKTTDITTYFEIENGVAFELNGFFYQVVDVESTTEELIAIGETFSKSSHLQSYIEVELENYEWPDFLPYGEPTSVVVRYENTEMNNDFNLRYQSIGYFNSTVFMWDHNKPAGDYILNGADLFLSTEDAEAYYSEMDERYTMTATIGDNKVYLLQPISQVYGTQASIYYEKPENWETELQSVFYELVDRAGLSTVAIQEGSNVQASATPSGNVEDMKELEIIDKAFYIYGITLGTTRQEVEAILGINADIMADESGFNDLTANYTELNLRIGYRQTGPDKYVVADVNSHMHGGQYHVLLNTTLENDPVRDANDPSRTSYFYYKETNQVVKLTPDANKDYDILLMPGDDYFYSYHNIK